MSDIRLEEPSCEAIRILSRRVSVGISLVRRVCDLSKCAADVALGMASTARTDHGPSRRGMLGKNAASAALRIRCLEDDLVDDGGGPRSPPSDGPPGTGPQGW
jgi:hypothetical protein